ncbi:DUF4260 domain-containing protein [Rhizobium halophilum]|uniref:DUF4260 domain-containing protein n=1 Tax=Rhizobium halophilum TaxID=2846852 RepID=UPI001EFE6641|nr:DUF4260 domain-containing protein [Rhizobium halophilum]MCF6368888.1 DUF4260 domain-containing protein [Rhizobium halophilum]
MTLLLRLENLAIALLALGAYWQWGDGWGLFLLLVLAPDISMLAYVFGLRAGAIGYNTFHSFISVGLLSAAGYAAGWSLAVPIALIWTFHIALDRALGYGLKYESGFADTHLGRIGRSLNR